MIMHHHTVCFCCASFFCTTLSKISLSLHCHRQAIFWFSARLVFHLLRAAHDSSVCSGWLEVRIRPRLLHHLNQNLPFCPIRQSRACHVWRKNCKMWCWTLFATIIGSVGLITISDNFERFEKADGVLLLELVVGAQSVQ